jgi:peptide/nickel transport system permease protein
MSADVSPSAERASGYWTDTWRHLRRNRPAVFGLGVVGVLAFLAVLAPLLANDRPIACRLAGDWKFPAFTGYVDAWVPWRSLRNDLKSLKIAGSFPFSDHEADLQGRTWKQAREEGLLSLALWPPVPWHPSQFSADELRLPPSRRHWAGTDDHGRDVLARLIHGAVVAMTVGVVSVGIATAIGVTLGLMAGYLGGWWDLALSRLTEIVIVFPTFFLVIAVIAFLEPSMINIMLVLGLFGWPGIFRLIRGEVLRVRQLDYVTAAEALGMGPTRLLFRHVMPNAVPPVFVAIAFGIAGAILAETSLSFLGFGDPSVPSWGEIASQGRAYVQQGLLHLVLFPGLAIFITLTGFNLLGQGLRDAMDPKLRGSR